MYNINELIYNRSLVYNSDKDTFTTAACRTVYLGNETNNHVVVNVIPNNINDDVVIQYNDGFFKTSRDSKEFVCMLNFPGPATLKD